MYNLPEMENSAGIADDVGSVMNYSQYPLSVVAVHIVIRTKQEIKEAGSLYTMFNINRG